MHNLTLNPMMNVGTYIHFLDYYHYQRAKTLYFASYEDVFCEAFLAFRIAFLFSSELFLPASTYVESPLARDILQRHRLLQDIGFLRVVAAEWNFPEHIEVKRTIYTRKRSPKHLVDAYRNLPAGPVPRYQRKTKASVEVIRKAWIGELSSGDIRQRLDPDRRLVLPSSFEKVWASIPEKLASDDLAFVTPHVKSLVEQEIGRPVPPRLFEPTIEVAYVDSYIRDLDLQLIMDLYLLGSPFESQFRLVRQLSYRGIAGSLAALDLFECVRSMTDHQLLQFKWRSEWRRLAARIIRQDYMLSANDAKLAALLRRNASFQGPPGLLAGRVWYTRTVLGRLGMSIHIFVSHSEKDKIIAKALVGLLEAALVLPEGAVRCTSLDGYRISIGQPTAMELQQNLRDAKVVVALLSERSLVSSWVMFELGAAWGLGRTIMPILCGITPDKLAGPIRENHAANGLNLHEIIQFVQDLQRYIGNARSNTPRIAAAASELVETIKAALV
jgi:hypothetical protein